MITRDQLIEIGHFNKAHGVNGEVNASLLIDVEHLPGLSCLVCDMDGIYVPFFVEAIRPKGATSVLLTIDGFTNEQEVATLVGKDIFALKRDYDCLVQRVEEDDDELPLDYFIGFHLTDNDILIGEIIDVDESTENALFIVRRDDNTEVSIPAVDDLITSMDMEQRVIDMDLPEGLLTIN
jgi:16S rRNA processing protein RimM